MNTDKHRFRIAPSLACAVLLTGHAALATELNLNVSLPDEPILVGDQVELVVSTTHPTNWTVTLPEIGREKEIVVLKRDWDSEPLEDGTVKTETVYTLTSFRLGEHVITTNLLTYSTGQATFTNRFPEKTLHVVSSLEENASGEIADIKPMQKLPGRVPPWLWITLGTALTAFLVGLISSKLWKNRETLVPSAPPIPPYVIAFRALEALKNKGLLEKDECSPFYTELSVILRTYLEGRFNLNAPDETTEEIVEEMSKSPELDGSQRNILQEFMRQADMVKFAKGHPDRSTMEAAFGTTKQFVEQTRQPEDLATRERKEPKGRDA